MPTASVQERRRTGQQTATTAPATTALAQVPKELHPFVQQWNLDRTQVDVIKQTCCPKGTSDVQMALFFHECARRGVHPMDRLLIMTLFRDDSDDDAGDTKNAEGKKPVFITTIDLHRAQAEDTGAYAGTDEPSFGPDTTIEVEQWEGKGQARRKARSFRLTVPSLARVRVWKMVDGTRTPFIGVARWKEFYPGPRRGAKWHGMPYNMLAKCAEAQALRKAFPRKLGRLYIREEMEQAYAADEAKRAGRGKTRAAAADVVDVPLDPLPDPEGIHDVTNADEHETPPASRWTVHTLVKGTKKGGTEPFWQLRAVNGEQLERVFYTDNPGIALLLERFKQGAAVFTIIDEARGGYAFLTEVAAL